MAAKPKPKPENPFESNPLFLEVMAEALAIQDRFSAEPVGVQELQQLKEAQKPVAEGNPG
jgi:hypothetical protein